MKRERYIEIEKGVNMCKPMFFSRYRQQIIQFAIIWCCVAVWQMLVVFSLLGVFLFTDYLLGYMFEIFCFGHILCLLTGDLGYGGGMPFSDWRWITGAVLMLMVSILATFPKNRILRISASLLFVGLLIFGSLGTLADISQHC